jgi:hypothetical protein
MNKIIYYRQKRYDGAIRTGIVVNGDLVLESLENESDEPDPALLWYVDVRCEGKRLPTNVEEVRSWLLKQSPIVRHALGEFAEELQAGMDVDVWPLQRKIAHPQRGVRMNLVCSVARRLEALKIADILRGLAEVWEESIRAAQQPLEALQR